ncbi:hypothetical protein GCM10020358_39890 [Amorphoplanes nipponensis]|uniref:TIR domain-containing protein n=1 Tax=Actinoplanes nipponensis TaxID=135950 RepID=A0A919MQW6_9ACTN|nr:TIR domain-containing protein [Actinoplanes nipponensis]GIE50973.1 hypothetical protein Ani05nite_45070 [Actinoplanes nipponensis]
MRPYTYDELVRMTRERWQRWGSLDGCRVIEDHRARVRSLCVGSLNGRPAAVSGDDAGVILMHDVRTGRRIGRAITTGTGPVLGLRWLPARAPGSGPATDVVVAADAGGVSLWDPVVGAGAGPRIEVASLTCVAVAELAGEKVIVTGSGDGMVRLWRPGEGTAVQEFYGGSDGADKIYSVEIDGIEIRRVGEAALSPGERIGHGPPVLDGIAASRARATSAVLAVDFSASPEPLIAIGNRNSDILVWSTDAAVPTVGHADVFGQVTALSVAYRDHQAAVVCGHLNGTFEVLSLPRFTTVVSSRRHASAATGPINSLAWVDLRDFEVPVGDFPVLVGASGDGLVHVWGPQGERLGQPWPGHTAAVNAFEMTALDGWPIGVSVSDDHTVRLWDFAEFAAERTSTSARERFRAKLEAMRLRELRPTDDVTAEIGVSATTFWNWVHGRSLPRNEEQVTRLERSLAAGNPWEVTGELVAFYRAARREQKTEKLAEPRRDPRRKQPDEAKDYDLFISYNHADRRLVEGFAEQLRREGVRLWYDRWEMSPGDVLRDRISDGIVRAKHFMVLISRSSLRSRWVRYELNSGMIEEIESGTAKVIPVLGQGVRHEDLPADLRAKYHLDLRTPAERARACQELVRLVQPEKRLRRERLDHLRTAAAGHDATEERRQQLRSPDEQIALAALQGLVRTPGTAALVAIAERSFDVWKMSVLKRCFTSLRTRHADGGILALTATLLIDSRFYYAKLDLLRDHLRNQHAGSTELIDLLSRQLLKVPAQPRSVPETMQLISSSPVDDVRHGGVLARVGALPSWAHGTPAPGPVEIAAATTYADGRLPGLAALAVSRAWQRL